eukprot:c20184_g1_i2.p1 GENE.c20184_g1_i2~~c20184_g1_i2.p1  ORF type:complete len:951 (+),score=301.42 c20184_g1_i2:43-2895(+)
MRLVLIFFLLFLSFDGALTIPLVSAGSNNHNEKDVKITDEEEFYSNSNSKLLAELLARFSAISSDILGDANLTNRLEEIKKFLENLDNHTNTDDETRSLLQLLLSSSKLTKPLLKMIRGLNRIDESRKDVFVKSYDCWNSFFDNNTNPLSQKIADDCLTKYSNLTDVSSLSLNDGFQLFNCIKSVVSIDHWVNVTKACMEKKDQEPSKSSNQTETDQSNLIPGINNLVSAFMHQLNQTESNENDEDLIQMSPPSRPGFVFGKHKSHKKLKTRSVSLFLRAGWKSFGSANMGLRLLGFIILILSGLAFLLIFSGVYWNVVPVGLKEIGNFQTGVNIISYWVEAGEAIIIAILTLAVLILAIKKSLFDPFQFMCAYRSSETALDFSGRAKNYVKHHNYDAFIHSMTGSGAFGSIIETIEEEDNEYSSHSHSKLTHDMDEDILSDNEINFDSVTLGHVRVKSYAEWTEERRPIHWYSKVGEDRFDFIKYLVTSYFICERDLTIPRLKYLLLHHAAQSVPHTENELESLLHEVYLLRKLQLWQAVASRQVEVADEKFYQKVFQHNVDIKNEIHDIVLDFKIKLYPMWVKLEFVLEKIEANKEYLEAIEYLEYIFEKLFFMALAFHMIFEFIDLEGECKYLVNSNRKPIGMPGDHEFLQRIGYGSKYRWNLSPLYNARTWECTHYLGPIEEHGNKHFSFTSHGNVEQHAVCSLKCKAGYEPAHGITYCDSLGGAGYIWSHLNGGLKNHGKGNVDEPACCIASSKAEHLSIDGHTVTAHLSLENHKVDFTWPAGVSRSCRSQGDLETGQPYNLGMILQVCSSNDEAICKKSCRSQISTVISHLPQPKFDDSGHETDHGSAVLLEVKTEAVSDTVTTTTTDPYFVSDSNCVTRYIDISFPADVEIPEMTPELTETYYRNEVIKGGSLTFSSSFTPVKVRLTSFGYSGIVEGDWEEIS